MEFKEEFKELVEAKAKESDYPKLEKKARKALDKIDSAIDEILEIMLATGEKNGGKTYKTFNKDAGNAWETANNYIDKEFGKDY